MQSLRPINDVMMNRTEHNQSAPLTERGGHVDYAHSSSYLVKTTLASEGISITDNDSKIEQPKQEVLLTPEGHPILAVQSAQNYGLNLMSTMLGTQQVQFDGSELQAQETPHLPSFVLQVHRRCPPAQPHSLLRASLIIQFRMM